MYDVGYLIGQALVVGWWLAISLLASKAVFATARFIKRVGFRVYVMWALGNMVFVALALGKVPVRAVVACGATCRQIWRDAQVQPLPPSQPQRLREPGWALRQYRERMGLA